MAEGNEIVLDPEAQNLFEQLGGTESWKVTQQGARGANRLAQGLLEEQKRQDAVRSGLIQLTYLISRYLADGSFIHKEADESKIFRELTQVLTALSQGAGHLGAIFIRYRGTPATSDLPDKYDYEVVIGNTAVDAQLATRVARRMGAECAQLPDQLMDAFSVMADYGVNNIFLRLPDNLTREMGSLQLCLKILCGFRDARHSGKPIEINGGQLSQKVPLINDENLYPDPNLTLVAGLNRFSTRSMETMVEKVDQWLRRQNASSAVKKYAGVYNAALELPKLSAQLKKPMVELNNVKWLLIETDKDPVSLGKVHMAQLAMDAAGASPQKVAKILKSVYGDDYAKINTDLLGERLHLSSDLLYAAEKRAQKIDLKKELLGNLQERLDQVQDHVMDDIQVREDTGSDARPAGEKPPDIVHSHIYRMVSFYKGRSTTRKKMVGMVHRPMTFTARDYEILAKDFRITTADAEALVHKLKACFDDQGQFKKNAFHEAISHFQQYEQKIFGFLWHHMKDVILPADRVVFLNALQTLTAQMNQPKRAFKVLIEDICKDPESVQFSDNKAVMLANLIIHRPDRALADYEITPEDIILNQQKLDKTVVEYAAWRIDKDQELFFTKIQTIHKKVAEALRLGQTSEKHIPASILLNLERELYIFLAMVSCDSGKAVLRSAVLEYGDPQTEIYHLKESTAFMSGLLQNLRVALRALGSVGSMQDISALERVRAQDENFQRLKKDRQHRAQARLITEWADDAAKFIKFRS